MSHSTDDLVQRKVDLNMSHQMHVPDSITVGTNRSNMPRLHSDHDHISVRMEVPNTIRLDNHTNPNESLFESPNDDDYTSIDPPHNNQQQPNRIADSWHIESFTDFDDRQILTKFQLLQNRIQNMERQLARRDFRDRIVYSCIFGYIVLQILFSVRRSTLN